MLDINFYMKFDEVIKTIESHQISGSKRIFDELEKIRSSNPIILRQRTGATCAARCVRGLL